MSVDLSIFRWKKFGRWNCWWWWYLNFRNGRDSCHWFDQVLVSLSVDGIVKRATTSVTHLKSAPVNLKIIQSLVDVLSCWITQCSISRQDPNVLGMEHSTQETVGTRVDNSKVSVVSVKNSCQSSLERKTKSVSNAVVSMLGYILNQSVSVDGNGKSSANSIQTLFDVLFKERITYRETPRTTTFMLPSLSSE